MQLLNRAYIRIYLIVLLLYVFFHKGVAYSYMAEIIMVTGIIILFINRKELEFGLEKKQIIIGLFILIYFPCVATIAAINKESGSWKWAAFTIFYTTALAWLVSFVVFQVGSLF